MYQGELTLLDDGIRYTNTYSKSMTQLGRLLSNFAHTPFECDDGLFHSMEAYWYWLGSQHKNKDNLRPLFGYEAKLQGKFLTNGQDYFRLPNFEEKICAAMRCKMAQNQVGELYLASSLPLTHYYIFNDFIKRDTRSDWLWTYLEQLHDEKLNVTQLQDS